MVRGTLPWSWVLWFSTLLVGPRIWDSSFSVKEFASGCRRGLQLASQSATMSPPDTHTGNYHCCARVFAVVFLCLCGCALCLCVCGCVLVRVCCGCVLVAVFVIVCLWSCVCGCVFAIVCLWLCLRLCVCDCALCLRACGCSCVFVVVCLWECVVGVCLWLSL